RRLDDRPAWGQNAAGLRVLDERERRAVLDRSARVHPLYFYPHLCHARLHHPLQSDERSPADVPVDHPAAASAGSTSTSHCRSMSSLSEWTTEQYFWTDSSTARATWCAAESVTTWKTR